MLVSKSIKKLYIKRVPFLFNERFLLEVFKKIHKSKALKPSSLLSLRLKLKGKIKLKKKQKKYSWLSFFLKLKKPLSFRVTNNKLLLNLQLSNSLDQNNLIENLEKTAYLYIQNHFSSINVTPLVFSFKKEHVSFIWKTQPQFFFYFKDLFNSLFSTQSFLLGEVFTFSNHQKKNINSAQFHFSKNSLVSNLYKTKSFYSFGKKTIFINAAYFITLQKLLCFSYFVFLVSSFYKLNFKNNFFARKFIFLGFNSLNFDVSLWEQFNLSKILKSFPLKTTFLDKISKKEKKIGALYLRRSSALLNTNLLSTFYLKSTHLTKPSKVLSLKNYIWKHQSNFFIKRSFDPQVKFKKIFKTKFKKSRKKSSAQVIYLLGRINNKLEKLNSIMLTSNQQELKIKLISLQVLLTNLLAEKKTRSIQQNMIFSSWDTIRNVRSILHVFPRNFQKSLDFVTKNKNYLEDFKYRNFIIYVLKRYISLKKILKLFRLKNKEKIIKLDEFGFNFREYNQSKLKLQTRILNSLNLLKKHKKWKKIISKKQYKSKKRIIKQLKKRNKKINKKKLILNKVQKRNLNLKNNKLILNSVKKILIKKFNNNKKLNIFRRKWITKSYLRKIFWFLPGEDFLKGWNFMKRNNWNGKQYTYWFRRLAPWTQRMLKYVVKLRLQRKSGILRCKRWDRLNIFFTKTPSVKFRFIYFRSPQKSKKKYSASKISEKVKLKSNKKRQPLFLKKRTKQINPLKLSSVIKGDFLLKSNFLDSQKKYLLLKQKRYFLVKQKKYFLTKKKNFLLTNQKRNMKIKKKTSKLENKNKYQLSKQKNKFRIQKKVCGFWRKSRWTWYKMIEGKGNRRPKRTLIGVRAVIAGKHTSFIEKKLLLSTWLGFPINLFFINTLSLTKFSLKLDRIQLHKRQASPNKIFSMFERDYINRYKYIAIYIKDFIRIGLISVFFKKPSFLAKFTAFQLAKLPRNRKETVFIRFLMKAIRTFARGRKEMLAVRIKFKGRVNRWRRTKFIMKSSGTFPFQTISERIEEGTAQAINRKGAIGIRIWLRYKANFMLKMQDHLLNYMRYSKIIKYNRIKKQLLLK